jgi:hypothetical protein
MEMHAEEYKATKEALRESQRLAEEFDICLSDCLLLRQLVQLRWLCQVEANEKQK